MAVQEELTVDMSPDPVLEGPEDTKPSQGSTAVEEAVDFSEHMDIDPGEVTMLPPPDLGDAGRELAKIDPKLYGYWREHIRDGFERNNEMFNRILDGFMQPYHTTIWMYRIIFGVGILSFLVAAGLSFWTREPMFGLIFGGLSVVSFLTFFVTRPLRALEENLEFITWLGIVYNTYWTRLAYMMNAKTVQEDLAKANKDATTEIERLIDKHAELSSRRPGLR